MNKYTYTFFHCATCRALAQLQIISEYSYSEHPDKPETLILFGHCVKCFQPGIVSKEEYHPPGTGEYSDRLQYYPPIPVGEEFVYKVPKLVKESYIEAVRCASAGAWLATLVMVRRALEAIGGHFAPKAKTLSEGLKKMKEKGIISEEIWQWGELLRNIGNASAHPTEQPSSRQDAEEAINFVAAIIETIYHLRPKFEALKARRSNAETSAKAPLSDTKIDDES